MMIFVLIGNLEEKNKNKKELTYLNQLQVQCLPCGPLRSVMTTDLKQKPFSLEEGWRLQRARPLLFILLLAALRQN